MLTGGAGWRSVGRAFRLLYGLKDLRGISPAGKTDPRIVEEIFRRRLGRPAKNGEVRRVLAEYLRHLPAEIRRSRGYRPLPGVRRLLRKLSKMPEVHLGLGTGNMERGARIKLKPGRLWRFFRFGAFGSDEADRVRMLRLAARRGARRIHRPLSGCRVIAVGDTRRDIRAAKKAGFEIIAVATGPEPASVLRRERPDLLLRRLDRDAERFIGFLRN